MENESVFLRKPAELYREQQSGQPITSLSQQLVKNISFFIGCNQESEEFQRLMLFMKRIQPDTGEACPSEGSFSKEFLMGMAGLESHLHGDGESQKIISECLKSALSFYQDDNVSVVETNPSTMTG